MKKETQINLRISEEDKLLMKKLARINQMNLSKYLRTKALTKNSK